MTGGRLLDLARKDPRTHAEAAADEIRTAVSTRTPHARRSHALDWIGVAECSFLLSANAAVLERAERLVAVWDGRPPSGKGGGTADVVEDARARGLAVDIVWPDGAARKD